MSTASERTHELFVAATLSDDDFGYPNGVEFVPGDQEWSDDVVWDNLTARRTTLLVGEVGELLLFPRRRSMIDRLRKRVTVTVAFRVNGRPGEFAVASRLGHHPVREMRERACAKQ
jgi:hypothetical protein